MTVWTSLSSSTWMIFLYFQTHGKNIYSIWSMFCSLFGSISSSPDSPNVLLHNSPSPIWGSLLIRVESQLILLKLRYYRSGQVLPHPLIRAVFLDLPTSTENSFLTIQILLLHCISRLASQRNLRWTDIHTTAFNTLKHRVCTAPVSVLPDTSQPFEIETDASQFAPGAVLEQNGHPVAYHPIKSPIIYKGGPPNGTTLHMIRSCMR